MSTQDIKTMLSYSINIRNRALVLFLASSGIRTMIFFEEVNLDLPQQEIGGEEVIFGSLVAQNHHLPYWKVRESISTHIPVDNENGYGNAYYLKLNPDVAGVPGRPDVDTIFVPNTMLKLSVDIERGGLGLGNDYLYKKYENLLYDHTSCSSADELHMEVNSVYDDNRFT